MPSISKCSCTSKKSTGPIAGQSFRNPFLNFFTSFRKKNKNFPYPEAAVQAGLEWAKLKEEDKKIFVDMSAKSRYIYKSRDKNLNKYLKFFRKSFVSDTDIDVAELQKTVHFLDKWKNKVYRSIK